MAKTCKCPYCGGTLGMRYDADSHTVIVEGVRPASEIPAADKPKSEDDLFQECLNELEDEEEG